MTHLVTVPDTRPVAIRRQALSMICERLDADAALFYRLYEAEGRSWFGDVLATGHGREAMPLADLSNAPAPQGSAANSPGNARWHRGYWTARMPLPEQRNRFRSFDDDNRRDVLREQAIWSRFYEPAGIDDQMRALVYDGDRFVGWVAGFRQGRGSRFADAENRAARQLEDEVVSMLVSADQLASGPSQVPTYATFDATGALLAATQAARDYFVGDRRQAMRGLVRRLDAGSKSSSGDVFWDGVKIRIVRLDDEDGVRYLAVIDRAVVPALSPLSRLTARQREVCEGAAVGCTTAEIASHLGLSSYTVKDHLKRAYERLGIGSRAELARLWQRSAPFDHFD